jgi:cytochrome o ubiquinol oxidase operon protein cyoD
MHARTKTYVVGYLVSIILTLISFTLVAQGALPVVAIVGVIVGLAVIQVVIQLIFFLHIGSGHGARWKIVTFLFAVLTAGILVGGSIWIMNNLNYNMLQYTPSQQETYVRDNEGF